MAFEDEEDVPTPVEFVWRRGFLDQPNLHVLYDALARNILSEQVPHAQRRAILKRAATGPLRAAVAPALVGQPLDAELRSQRSIVDVDTAMRPYYGNIRPALDELTALGLLNSAKTMWLDSFQHRSPVRRIVTVCQMVTWGGLFLLGEGLPAVGSPSRAARRQKVIPTGEVDTTVYRSAALMLSSFEVDVYTGSSATFTTRATMAAQGTVS